MLEKNKKIIIAICCLIVVIFIGSFIYSKTGKSNKKLDNKEQNNNSSTINNKETSLATNWGSNQENDENEAFLMAIEDVFSITEKGIVATGRIERGTIKVNDTVQIIGLNDKIKTTTVAAVEIFRKQYDEATKGDNVGLVFKEITKDDVKRGQVLAKPNSIKNATKFDAKVSMLSLEEGGYKTIDNNYRPQVYIRTADIKGKMKLKGNLNEVKPGQTAEMTIELELPAAIEVGTEISIREGGIPIGKGTITKVY